MNQMSFWITIQLGSNTFLLFYLLCKLDDFKIKKNSMNWFKDMIFTGFWLVQSILDWIWLVQLIF